MRKIEIKSWKAKIANGTEADETLLSALSALIAMKPAEEMPKGLDKFRLYNRLAKAFDSADKNKILVLEETDYKFLKDLVSTDIPPQWALNKNVNDAIESFLEAKEE